VKHLPDIAFPMLFVQGSRDPFGTPDELRPILKELKAPTDLYVVVRTLSDDASEWCRNRRNHEP
jgi:uncharacterized protein